MKTTSALTPAELATQILDMLLTERNRLDHKIREALRIIEARPPVRRSKFVIPECGSETAYQRHKHYREHVDAGCLEAHRLNNRVQYARARYGESVAEYVQKLGKAS